MDLEKMKRLIDDAFERERNEVDGKGGKVV